MPDLKVSLSDEELERLEELGHREGLSVVEMVRIGIMELLNQPDEVFRATAQRTLEKNAELYRRLA
jgi:hypothetical protein